MSAHQVRVSFASLIYISFLSLQQNILYWTYYITRLYTSDDYHQLGQHVITQILFISWDAYTLLIFTRDARTQMALGTRCMLDVDGLAQDCSNSIALTMELLQFCAKPSTCANDSYNDVAHIWPDILMFLHGNLFCISESVCRNPSVDFIHKGPVIRTCNVFLVSLNNILRKETVSDVSDSLTITWWGRLFKI